MGRLSCSYTGCCVWQQQRISVSFAVFQRIAVCIAKRIYLSVKQHVSVSKRIAIDWRHVHHRWSAIL
jgi:hypothetical protein